MGVFRLCDKEGVPREIRLRATNTDNVYLVVSGLDSSQQTRLKTFIRSFNLVQNVWLWIQYLTLINSLSDGLSRLLSAGWGFQTRPSGCLSPQSVGSISDSQPAISAAKHSLISFSLWIMFVNITLWLLQLTIYRMELQFVFPFINPTHENADRAAQATHAFCHASSSSDDFSVVSVRQQRSSISTCKTTSLCEYCQHVDHN